SDRQPFEQLLPVRVSSNCDPGGFHHRRADITPTLLGDTTAIVLLARAGAPWRPTRRSQPTCAPRRTVRCRRSPPAAAWPCAPQSPAVATETRPAPPTARGCSGGPAPLQPL